VLIARHLAPGDFFGGITWNFSFGFLRLVGSIQQKPVALSHRWLLSRHLRAPVGGVLGRSAWSRRHRQFLAPADPARPSAAVSALEPFALEAPPPQTYRAPGSPPAARRSRAANLPPRSAALPARASPAICGVAATATTTPVNSARALTPTAR
jgi:hypothetical protein